MWFARIQNVYAPACCALNVKRAKPVLVRSKCESHWWPDNTSFLTLSYHAWRVMFFVCASSPSIQIDSAWVLVQRQGMMARIATSIACDIGTLLIQSTCWRGRATPLGRMCRGHSITVCILMASDVRDATPKWSIHYRTCEHRAARPQPPPSYRSGRQSPAPVSRLKLGFVSKREGEAPAEPFWPPKQEAQQELRPPGRASPSRPRFAISETLLLRVLRQNLVIRCAAGKQLLPSYQNTCSEVGDEQNQQGDSGSTSQAARREDPAAKCD